MAQRANVSAAWYALARTGARGAPSAEVLERISRALMLTTPGREHSSSSSRGDIRPRFIARRGKVSRRASSECSTRWSSFRVREDGHVGSRGVESRGVGVCSATKISRATKRNILRRIFTDPQSRAAQMDWESVARFAVAAFRADTARAGASANVQALVERTAAGCVPISKRIWRENEVSLHGEGTKRLRHPIAGLLGAG